MRQVQTSVLSFGLLLALSLGPAADAQRRGGPGGMRRGPQAPPAIEFLGWDYAKLGYTLTPGEEMALLFRNNRQEAASLPVAWELTTYAGESLSQGRKELTLAPGATGRVPIPLPADLKEGAYFVKYSLGSSSRGGEKRFYFDFRRPAPEGTLSLRLVALIDDMDAEGWTRMMLGPLARYVNVLSDWPGGNQKVDAVLVIGETMKDDDPRLARLQSYVAEGGKMLLFGKPAASLQEMLPVTLDQADPWMDRAQRLRTRPGGPWQGFRPEEGPTRYGVRVKARADAAVLADWEDGSPAVVSWGLGKGRVVFVGSASGQVWQRRASLEGADEMGLRLLYWLARGEGAVTAMLDRAEQLHAQETAARTAVRDRVLADLQIKALQDYVVVSRNNVGRFGWLIEEGGLVDNLSASGRVSGPVTRAFSFGGTQPVVNVGARQATGADAFFSLTADGDDTPRPTEVRQNWLAKTVIWKYGNGAAVRSTLSLGSPGILWEGDSLRVGLTCTSATHVAFASPQGVRVVARGASLDPAQIAEGWLLAFTADPEVRDMPQLFVLTRRPARIGFDNGVQLTYSAGGFGALFSSRLWGIRRLAPGETAAWTGQVPAQAVETARRWSRVFLRYPVDCDEVGWVEGGTVHLADRFRFRSFQSDWGTEPLTLAPLAPVLSLARMAGALVQLPSQRIDLECPTKCGPLEAVPGETTLVRLPVPPRDHRALIPVEGRMVLQETIDARTAGLRLNQKQHPDQTRNEGAGDLHADLARYDISNRLPFNEAPCIDVYKWWLTFNSLLARPLYSESVREKIDRHFHMRYWETLNFYPHKCFVVQKREPWTWIEYIISFVWPTQTQGGWRNFNDGNEASGVNAYCFANYARYYGDWTTLRANWNLCRRLHEYLPRINDWACLASGALEYWRVAGLDMVNSEPYGNLAFAYAAAHAGYPQDELVGLVHGTRSLVAATARFGLESYLRSITAPGDPWRDFRGCYWLMEDGIQASRTPLGSIGTHDTSKGTHHELSLAYKTWIPQAIHAHEESLGGGASLPDLTQRFFLGWDAAGLLDRAKASEPRQPLNWTAAKDLYDLGLACLGDLPLFLSDWTPAEYISGRYDPQTRELRLAFRSHEGEPFRVRLYSQRAVQEVTLNDEPLKEGWRYDPQSGWLAVDLQGADTKHLLLRLGDPAAPLHPYFTERAK